MTTNTPNFELLKDAYAIIDGIPEKQFDLETFVKKGSNKPTCCTIACALGYLAMHPQFNALGLTISEDAVLMLNGRLSFFYEDVASMIFNISSNDARNLFIFAGGSALEPKDIHNVSDKQNWKLRVKAFLQSHGQWRGLAKVEAK
ncbi:MAG: hypothetical protein NVS3B3_04320 [Aquirhabdus sp.]